MLLNISKTILKFFENFGHKGPPYVLYKYRVENGRFVII